MRHPHVRRRRQVRSKPAALATDQNRDSSSQPELEKRYPPLGTAAMTSQPCCVRGRPRDTRSSALTIGSRSALPMEPRSAFQPNGSALAPAAITQLAPPASATRVIAPMLPGSCIGGNDDQWCDSREEVFIAPRRSFDNSHDAARLPNRAHGTRTTEAEAAAIAVWRESIRSTIARTSGRSSASAETTI